MSIVRKRGKGVRSGRGSRRLEMSAMRVALGDGRYWAGIGLVYKPNGEPSHFEIDDDVGVLVHVELMPSQEPLMCRLGGLGQGGTHGVWRIPPVGSEVAVLIPNGSLEGGPVLVAVLASGGVPSELDGDTVVIKGPSNVLVIGAEVQVRSEGGTAEPLITKSQFDAHVHPTGVGPSGTPDNAATSGTTVIKGE